LLCAAPKWPDKAHYKSDGLYYTTFFSNYQSRMNKNLFW
jgi:hypothetical protein